MTILYINGEHCTSMEQLRGYFEETPSYDSSLFYDLLDYARSGDLSSWLREKGETVLADYVDGIDRDLGDADYFSEVCNIVLCQKTQTPTKPDFSQCFSVENVSHEIKDTNFKVCVSLKVLQTVNENYNLKVETKWGIHVKKVNPFGSKKDEVLTYNFSFRKRPNCELNTFTVFADDIECFTQNITSLQMDISENTIEKDKIIKQILESEDPAVLIRYMEDNDAPQWITSVLKLLQESKENISSILEKKHTETYCNTDISTKHSEKRYRWQTEAFCQKVEKEKEEREKLRKKKIVDEREKEDDDAWIDEREENLAIERFRRKHNK